MRMHVSYLWVVVAALVQWLLGILWYGVIFRKSWPKLVGLAEGEQPKYRIFALIAGFVACLLLSVVMAHIFAVLGVNLSNQGYSIGVLCWLGFMAPPLIAQHILEGRRANLLAINLAYWLLAMGFGSAILAAFH